MAISERKAGPAAGAKCAKIFIQIVRIRTVELAMLLSVYRLGRKRDQQGIARTLIPLDGAEDARDIDARAAWSRPHRNCNPQDDWHDHVRHKAQTPPAPASATASLGPVVTAQDDDRQRARQYAALPWRRAADEITSKVLLITSRETRRWVIPKGWPMANLTPAEAAAQEAYEEAGVFGQPNATPIGTYAYDKRLRDGALQAVEVVVFPMEVFVEQLAFPERGQREKLWTSPEDAADKVDELELKAPASAAFRPSRTYTCPSRRTRGSSRRASPLPRQCRTPG